MELFTSRYQAGNLIMSNGGIPVQTSNGHPKFPMKYTIKAMAPLLVPSRFTLGQPDGVFKAKYEEQLERHGVDAIRRQLQEIVDRTGNEKLILLCFENVWNDGEKACHRRQFAEWWNIKTGETVLELPDPGFKPVEKGPKDGSFQPSLF